MKTLREQFEEDYAPVSIPAGNKKGFKVEYVYYAPWYLWDMEKGRLRGKKLLLAGLSGGSLLLYLFAGLGDSGANSFFPVAAAGILALCAHVFELSGIFQFLFAKYRTSRMTYSSVSRALTLAPLIRSFFLAVSAAGSVVYMVREQFGAATLFVASGYLICACMAFIIYNEYRKIPMRTEKNKTLNQFGAERLL